MTKNQPADPRSALFLVGDIGGTSARFGLATPSGRIRDIRSYPTDEHDGPDEVIERYLAAVGVRPEYAGIAVASTVLGDQIRLTNSNWSFSTEALRRRFGFNHLLVLNDFAALAWSVRDLEANALEQIGDGTGERDMPIGLLGASSGLGVSGLAPANGNWVPLTGEGGHVTISPHDDFEAGLVDWARKHSGGHVSAERFLSAGGLVLLREALAEADGVVGAPLDAIGICRAAIEQGDALCRRTVDTFCAMLGTAAANVALTLGARGGIYIGGGIVPRLGSYFATSPFRQRFVSKGRFSDYLAAIPTYVIHSESASLTGVAIALQHALQGGLLRSIRSAADQLSPAERAVAELTLQNPRFMLDAPVAEIAKRANVSQPTVIRFCRSLGCDTLIEFRRRLAQSLSSGTPVVPAKINAGDSLPDIVAKVFDGTTAALLRNRDELSGGTLEEVTRRLAESRQRVFFGLGSSGVVAEDAQLSFLRYGIHAVVYRDSHSLRMAAATLEEGATIVAISPSGRAQEVIDAVRIARDNGAFVIAIAPNSSPLAGIADASIQIDLDEEREAFAPVVSRAVLLAVIDALAIGVALRDAEGSRRRFAAGRRSLMDKFAGD